MSIWVVVLLVMGVDAHLGFSLVSVELDSPVEWKGQMHVKTNSFHVRNGTRGGCPTVAGSPILTVLKKLSLQKHSEDRKPGHHFHLSRPV